MARTVRSSASLVLASRSCASCSVIGGPFRGTAQHPPARDGNDIKMPRRRADPLGWNRARRSISRCGGPHRVAAFPGLQLATDLGRLAEIHLVEVPGREVPVHEAIQEGLHERLSPALVVEIVGVLPKIAGEQRVLPLDQGQGGVGRGRDLEVAVVHDEPGPTASELRNRRVDELRAELAEASKCLGDCLGERSGGLTAAARRHRVPEERVVPGLRRIVEDVASAFVAGSGFDDLRQAHLLEAGAGNQRVQLVDISRVVGPMVDRESLRRHEWLERIGGIR